MDEHELVMPIYVDTSAILDLIASIQGGFTVVEKINTRQSEIRNSDKTVNASIGSDVGISNLMNLIKLGIGYSSNWGRKNENLQDVETQRYHTY